MKNNPTNKLKVSEKLYKRAKEKGLLNEVIFYYGLKSLNIEGRIYNKEEIYSTLKSKLKKSVRYIKDYIKKLVSIGFLKEKIATKGILKDTVLYYQLISYDSLWEILGYSMEKKCSKIYKNKKNITEKTRNGNFEIFKISTSNISNLKEYIWYEEIKLNFQRQCYAILKKIRNLIKTGKLQPSKAMQKTILKGVKLDDIRTFRLLNNNLLSLDENNFKWFRMGIADVTLSCKGVAELFGYKTAMSGWKIEKQLESMGLLKIKTRKCLVTSDSLKAKTIKKEFADDDRFVLRVKKPKSKVSTKNSTKASTLIECSLYFFNSNLLTPITY